MGFFNNNQRPTQPMQPQSRPMNNVGASGCKIKVRRDSSGRVSSIETNGRCSKQELEIFRDNMGMGEDENEED